ncbi:MAG: alpha/beta hydrolase [Smithellaceae bacterium]
MKTIKSHFISKGIRCDGELLLPDGVTRPPVVIMGHGLAAQKIFGLMPYAERFIKKNMAVFLFDYRTFGKSDGTPRQIVDPFRHLEDWKAAISHVRKIQEVDSARIALWGSSFAGGHVIATAAEEDGISAVVSQVPHVSTFALLTTKSLTDIFRSAAYGIYDLIRAALGMSPHYSPVIARPGSFAIMNTEESYDGYMSIVGKDRKWENRLTSRIFIKILFYNPTNRAKRIKAPVLIMAGAHDSLVPLAAINKCAAKIPKGELVVMDCNHFAPYTGDTFLKYIHQQVAFLEKHLL